MADLSRRQLAQRLAGPGLPLRTGPVLTNIRSALPAVVQGIALHYAEHPIELGAGFTDFQVSVERPKSLRRWFKRQVVFGVDGQRPFTPLPGNQEFPMLEWGLNSCISGSCHQYLTLHAAVLERGGRALVLPAPSGSGKSTLCAGLMFSGWRLLSDELTVLDPRSGEVVPLPRPVSLKNASIELVRGFAAEAAFGPIVRETLKGSVAHLRPPADAVRRAAQRALPAWVVLPRYAAGAETSLQALSKGRALMRLIESAFNFNVHGRRGFELLADVIERSDCYEFTYSRLDEAIEIFSQLAPRDRIAA